MLCHLCGQPGKFAKSHIIPEAFWRELRNGKDMPLLVSNSPNTFPQRAPIGVYDQTILCEKCEPKFNDMDDYGINVFLKQRSELFQPLMHEGREVASQTIGVDQKRLLIFLIGTLWRASVSSSNFFRRVQLGSLQEIARQVVLNPEANIPPVFGAVLSKWNAKEEHQSLAKGLMDPFPERWGNVNAYRFYFGEIVAYIKADQRPFPDHLAPYALGVSETLTLIARQFDKSKDFQALRHTALQSHTNHLAVRGRGRSS